MTYLEIQVAGLSKYWWQGHTAAHRGDTYSVDGLTAEQRAACEAGYEAGAAEIAEHGDDDR